MTIQEYRNYQRKEQIETFYRLIEEDEQRLLENPGNEFFEDDVKHLKEKITNLEKELTE